MNPKEIDEEMKDIIKMKRKNLEWQLEYMRIHFPWMTSDPYEDEDE